MRLFSFPKRKLKKLIKEGEYKEAIEFGKTLEKQHPNDPDLLFIMGSIFYILKDAKNSMHYFNKVLEINEYDTETLFLKANVHVFLKEYRQAIDCCKKIISIDSDNKDAKDLLAQLKNN